MTNPWLQIPASDYEAHMDSPNVNQLSFLASTFCEAVENHDAGSIAILGCATGNGLQHVKDNITRRVTAVDIHPEYLDILRQRYENRISGLEIVEADLEQCTLERDAYSLVFAGLVFEYLNPEILLLEISHGLKLNGVLVSILQLSEKGLKNVSETPYTSLKVLESVIHLIAPEKFSYLAEKASLQELQTNTITLESGKPFFIGTYLKV